MLVYERQSYAPKSTVATTASKSSTLLTKQRQMSFVTEWYWYPEGVKTVADRFNRFLVDNDLISEHTWDESLNRFCLRCRTQDSMITAEAFRDVLATIIKEELKKGYKDFEPWVDEEDESEEDKEHYRKLLERLGPEDDDELSDDEVEALELDIEESLGSRLIRRLKLHEDETRARAQLNTAAELDSQRPVAEREEYPASIRSLKFKVNWLGYFQQPLELEKILPDDVLAELKSLTGCEFSKCIRTGTLYMGCNAEQGLEDAQRKLSNLKVISQSEDPYTGHILYYEALDVSKFVLQLMINIRKDYFATTLLDNLHLAVNSDDRREGELLPAWGKLCNAVTIRYALLDVSTNLYEPVKKVDLSAVPSSLEASFKDWDGFRYSSKNETSYLRRYVDPKTGGLLPRTLNAPNVPSASKAPGISRSTSLNTVEQGQSAMPRSASLNTIEQSQNEATPKPALKPDTMPHMNDSVQKTMRIKQWQEEVGSLRPEVNDVNHEDESKLPAFLRSPDYVEPSGTLTWDTYQEISIEAVRRNRMEKSTPTLSKCLERRVAAMVIASAGNRAVPITRQAAAPGMPRSVTRSSLEQLQNANQRLPKGTVHPAPTNQSQPQFAEPLSDVTNSQAVDATLHTRASESLISFGNDDSLSVVEQHAILDDDVSMVNGSILQPARPGDNEQTFNGALSLHLQAIQSESTLSEDEDLICLTPPPELEVLIDLSTSPTALGPDRSLLDVSDLKERLQTEDEVETRVFYSTMNQKAGKGRPKEAKSVASSGRLPLPSPPRARPTRIQEEVEDPSPYVINDITESFTELLDSIRFFRGSIAVQLEFGRIFLTDCPSQMIWQKPADKVFDHNALRAKLKTLGRLTSFTKVLSLVPQEMEFLIGMKNREGKSLWQPSSVQPPKWVVTYEFHYRDLKALDSPFFLVSIDGETFKTQLFVRKELGATYIHGVARHWDYRIAATGEQSIRSIDRAHGVCRSIEKSLTVPSQTETPRLLWEMETSLIERYQLVELVVKRVKKYPGLAGSDNGGSELNITEMQSLEVETREAPERSSCVFMAAPSPYDRHPTEKLTKWWEASITSVQLNKMLEENRTLPLGDEAAWAIAPLNPSIAPALFSPACEMLKQMDGVGQHNRNGIIRKEISENQEVAKKSKTPGPEDIGFW